MRNAQGAGAKGQVSLNFNCKASFKDCLTKLCVSSQMKDIKHIRLDFHLVALVMSQWWDLGVLWGLGGSKYFFSKFNPIWCVSFLHEWHMQRHMSFLIPAPWGLGEGQKGQISLNLNYKVNFKYFKPNCVYLLTNESYEIYQMGFSCGRLGHVPGEGLGGTPGSWGSKIILKFNQISCVCYSHKWHMQRHNFYGPAPLGP